MNKLKTKAKISYFIHSESKLWPKRLPKVRKIIRLILDHSVYFVNKKILYYDIIFFLSNNKRIKKLNKIYKKISKPTDVLTFTDYYKTKNYQNVRISNIILSAEIIKRDSGILKKDFYNHFAHLIIHSLLHSNGYKHNTLVNKKIMENLENNILKKLKIQNPYL